METLSMSVMERRRLTVFSQVKERVLSVAQGGRLLGLSERQARRLWKRYRQRGDAGLIHGLRGRPGNAARGALRDQVLAACRGKYRGFSSAHARDFLAQEKLAVPRTTCWRWMKAEGLVVCPRRVKPHRRRRERRAALGELLQMDGSTHAWFGPELPQAVLFVMIDDASSRVWARFYATEDTVTAFDLFGRYARQSGLPLALYVDCDSIYRVNDEPARQRARERGQKTPLTQFGRAMEQLGVGLIFAGSPQAKGRVERVNRTFQDRLVKELALLGITTLAGANAYLEKTFLKSLHSLIGRTPASGANVHRPVPRHLPLADVLCVVETRVVGQDWCVRIDGRILQIHHRHQGLALAGKPIQVLQRADGTLALRQQNQPLIFSQLAARPVSKAVPQSPPPPYTPQPPAATHPWKRSYKGMRGGLRSTAI
ncbi:MAG TPA: ISNCY family transposase [Bryobacteraceae bacterium]|nr:ISNCY family transposase [Bryobacteraceae bacterium]